MTKPFIKWVGGKHKLLPIIEKNLPNKYNKIIEPFVGSGSIFLYLNNSENIINDINTPLINVYRQIKANPLSIMSILSEIENEFNNLKSIDLKAEYYYKKRNEFNKNINMPLNKLTDYDACLFIFLNKTCFNGLYRVNKNGLFNASFNKLNKLALYDKENIIAVSKILRNTDIYNADFENLESLIRKDDFVFIDSPYYDTYTGYNKDSFTENDHIRLYDLVNRLTQKGTYCMVTNSNTDYIKNLYSSYNIQIIDSIHCINRNGNDRKRLETLITNYR